MTDYPIPDELRDAFVQAVAQRMYDRNKAPWPDNWSELKPQSRQWYVDCVVVPSLDIISEVGHLPEFAVHNNTCCGGTGESCGHIIRCDKRPGVIGSACTLRVPCPGVGYYHWTRSEDR